MCSTFQLTLSEYGIFDRKGLKFQLIISAEDQCFLASDWLKFEAL